MKLTELVDFEAEKTKIDQMKQIAKQQAARVKSAQAKAKDSFSFAYMLYPAGRCPTKQR